MQNKIKEYRVKRGLTQTELAEKTGISRQYISGIENGTVTNITTDVMIKIAEVLKVKANTIFLL